MYYNGQKGMHVSTFVNMVHADMVLRYGNKAKVDDANAIELQNFFQKLKQAAIDTKQGKLIEDEVISIIVSNLRDIMSKRSNAQFYNLFQERGGARFENEITDVINAIYQEVGEEDFQFDKSQVNIGSMVGTSVNLSDELLADKNIQNMLQTIGTKTQKYIVNSAGEKMLVYYLPEVDGKIDVKGYKIHVKANPSPAILKIYNLLQDATFTAKNYDSMTWDQKMKEFVQQSGHSTLSLGKSNVYRAIVGVLEGVGYEHRTSVSAFWAGYNKINQGDVNVATHFYHLRYLYELTGVGIKYNGQNFGEAKYLIYNDPHGNIYVKSTAVIFSDVLNELLNNPQSYSMHISISKKSFY